MSAGRRIATARSAFADGSANVVGGTAWLWSREDMDAATTDQSNPILLTSAAYRESPRNGASGASTFNIISVPDRSV